MIVYVEQGQRYKDKHLDNLLKDFQLVVAPFF
jgi:hypothetical protein